MDTEVMRRLEVRILYLENTVKFLKQKNAELEKILKNTISIPIPKNYESSLFEPVAGHGGSKSTKQTNKEYEDSEDESIGD